MAVGVVLYSLFMVFVFMREESMVRRSVEDMGSSIAKAVSVSTPSWVLSKDLEALDEVIQGVSNAPDLHLVYILDGSGRVLASNREEDFNRILSDPISRGLIESAGGGEEAQLWHNGYIDTLCPILVEQDVIGYCRVILDGSRIERELSRNIQSGIAFLLFALVIGGLFFFFVITGIIRRLTLLTESAHRIEEGDFDFSLSPLARSGNDEVTILADAFSYMIESIHETVDKLNRSRQELERHKESLEKTVDERTRELKEAKEAAEKANAAKSDFLAHMSHEIRTPLNGIVGLTDILIEMEKDENAREYLTYVKTASDSLMRIINDILDLSKIEAGKLSFHNEVINLRSFLSSFLPPYEMQARRKGLVFTSSVDPAAPDYLQGPLERIQQILINLIGNAIKFTEEGEIRLSVSEHSRTGEEVLMEFALSDTGLGIPEDRRVRIFEAFSQADSSTAKHYGGTGLGLSISKRLIDEMKGSIEVESEPGKGSTFTVIIPLLISRTLPPSEAAEKSGSLRRADSAEEEEAKPLRILIAEDDRINRMVIRVFLDKMGHEVKLVTSGSEALRAIEEEGPFDLLFTDIGMPEMDGFQLAREIREREKVTGSHIHIVALTAHAMKGFEKRCLEAGMDGYLPKPLNFDEIKAILGSIGRNSL